MLHVAPVLEQEAEADGVALDDSCGGKGVSVHGAHVLDRDLGEVVVVGNDQCVLAGVEEGCVRLGGLLKKVLVVTAGGDGLVVELNHADHLCILVLWETDLL
eukprot:371591_1